MLDSKVARLASLAAGGAMLTVLAIHRTSTESSSNHLSGGAFNMSALLIFILGYCLFQAERSVKNFLQCEIACRAGHCGHSTHTREGANPDDTSIAAALLSRNWLRP